MTTLRVLSGLIESAGKEDPENQPPSPGCRWERWGTRWGHTYLRPKDSNAAVGVRDRATGKAPERHVRQTVKQTNFKRMMMIRIITA